jgi:TP901 family phage tail tape measure protein
MAKQIRANELFEKEDIFEGIRKSAEKTMATLEKIDVEFKKIGATLKKDISKAKIGGAKELREFMALVEKANNLQTNTIKLEKEKTIAEQQNEKLKQQKIRTQNAESRQQERINKQKEKQRKLLADENNAYKKLVKSTRDLKNQSKQLGAELLMLEQSGKKNTAQYFKLEKQYKKVTQSAKQGDKQLKKLDKTVGDNFRNVGNYSSALGTLRNGLMQLGIAFGTAQIVRNVTGIIVDFDQAQADLTAISGKTTEELKGLTEQAKQLGSTTQFTATEITQMQIELAKLGFTTDQIEQSTKAVSNFASATGSDLASASKVAGSSLRAFGLEANEMERVVSVLGVATTKSGLSFSSYETAMSTISPVAKQFGFSIEDTVTLMAKLADAGFDASTSATATRKILLNLANTNGELAQELGRPITRVEDLGEALQELKDKGIDLNRTLELTDVRSVSAFGRFIDASDTFADFKESITDVNGELQTMADKRLDSIQGQLTLLSSAWEGYILQVGEAGSTSESLKSILGFLANNLSTIMDTLFRLIRAFVIYKTTMIALRTVQRL